MAGSDPLDALRQHLKGTLIGVDYDGTLAPIVDDPREAVPLPEAVAALGSLVGSVGCVVVISGRPVDYLRSRLWNFRVGMQETGRPRLVVQYGLERASGNGIMVDPRAGPYRRNVEAARREARRRGPRLTIEPKGYVALTLHWRNVRVPPPREELEACGEQFGLEILEGRKACEFRPPIPVDKGSAFAEFARKWPNIDRALFAGDDRGDLAVFDALDELTAEGTLEHGVRVGVRSDEAPPEILERADVLVDGPAGVAELLSSLAPP